MIFGKDKRRMANLITENAELKSKLNYALKLNQEISDKLDKKIKTKKKEKK